MGGKSTTSTQSVQIPPEVLARYNAVNTRAEQVAQQPFMQYPGQFVAGLTPTQQAGVQNTSYYSQLAQPYYGGAVQQLMAGQQAAQPAIGAAYESLAQAQDVGQQYGQAATQAYGQAQGMALPYYQAATQGVGSALAGAQPYQRAATQFGLAGSRAVSPAALNVGQFMSPYTEAVARTTQEALAQQQGQERAQQQAQAIRAGAFGGERAGLERANLARQQTLGMAQALAPIYQQGYGQALAAAQQQQGVGLGAEQANRAALQQTAQQMAALGQQGFGQQMGAAQQMQGIGQGLFGLGTGTGQALAGLGQQQFGQGTTTAQQLAALGQQQYGMGAGTGQALASLGTGAQQAALQGAQAQIGAGTLEQQTQQADLTARYQQFLQERGYPFQVAQFLANIAMGTGALSGSTTTTTQPTGFFSDRRLKEDVAPVGKTFDGQTIYRYKYKGDDRTQIGLMADEVQKKKPEAVGLHGGYKTVDYEEATEDAARAKKAGGGLVGADDLRAILEAQRAGFGPFGAGIYGGAGQGMPMGKSGLGYVPAGALPVPKLVTAGGLGAQRPSGLSEAASAGRNIAEMAKMGGEFKDWVKKKLPGEKAVDLPKQGPEAPRRPVGGTTVTKTTPTAAADLPSEKAKVASLESEALGFKIPGAVEETPDLATMFAARGGVVPGRYAKGGSINPYDADKNPMDYFPEEVLEEGDPGKLELPKPGQAPSGRGKSGASDLMNVAGTLASFIPGVGPVIGTGMKAASMFMADGGVVDGGAFAYGGLVPRHGYATDGAVEEIPVETVAVEEKPIFDLERAKRAIAANESGGRYGAIGPDVQRKGFVDRAYGKYQVMGANIPSWTEEALGTRMTPEEYLANPEAQEKTFAHHFGKFATQHGNPYDAASVWFSGKPIAEAGDRRDVLKTTVPAYVSRFKSVYDAESDLPSRGAQPVEYRQGLGGGRGEEPTIGRESSLGDVADRFLPEGVPTSSNFWVPALGFVGSMLASNRPTLGGALGEGIVGGVSAFQEQRKQEADLAKGVIDLMKDRFTRTVDKDGNVVWRDNYTGSVVSSDQFKALGAGMLKARGVPPAKYGFGDAISAPSGTGVPQIEAPKAPPAPGQQPAPAVKEQPKPGAKEEESEKVLQNAPDEGNLLTMSEPELIAHVRKNKERYGLIGDRDPDVMAAEIALSRKRSDELGQIGRIDEARLEKEEADRKQARMDGYLKSAAALQLGVNQKRAEEIQKDAVTHEKEAGARIAQYANARSALVRLADILSEYKSGRLKNYLADIQGVMQTLGVDDPRITGGAAKFDEAMKIAMTQAFGIVGDQNLSRAPKEALQKAVQTVPNPTLQPGAAYSLIGREIGRMDYFYDKDKEYLEKYAGMSPAQFELRWSKNNKDRFQKTLARAYSEIPVPEGEAGGTIDSLKRTYGRYGYVPRLAERSTTAAPAPATTPAPAPVTTAPAPEQGGQDLLPGFGKARTPASDLPLIQTPQEAEKLPKGTRFRSPDGKIREVP